MQRGERGFFNVVILFVKKHISKYCLLKFYTINTAVYSLLSVATNRIRHFMQIVS